MERKVNQRNIFIFACLNIKIGSKNQEKREATRGKLTT